ncbi:MAG: FAD:protein FMN transferase [Actinomycetota bacterium]|nr:FAD:protein FMN transferase [Actinomycetota bacterium]
MPFSVDLRGVRPDQSAVVHTVLDRCFDSLRDADNLMSLWRADTPLARLSAGRAGLGDMPLEVVDVLRRSVLARRETAGHFDARRPDGRIDPTGLVKGWALARVGRLLLAAGFEHWCLNGAGDVLVHGHSTGATETSRTGPGWTVGVSDPADGQRLLTAVVVHDGAVATSGNAHRGEHIWAPSTGGRASGLRAASVLCSDIVRADVMATAAVARGRDAMTWLDRLDGLEALVVYDEGGVGVTSGWPTPLVGT